MLMGKQMVAMVCDSLPSREIIADSIELTYYEGYMCDAMITVSVDKTVPGTLMPLPRTNRSLSLFMVARLCLVNAIQINNGQKRFGWQRPYGSYRGLRDGENDAGDNR